MDVTLQQLQESKNIMEIQEFEDKFGVPYEMEGNEKFLSYLDTGFHIIQINEIYQLNIIRNVYESKNLEEMEIILLEFINDEFNIEIKTNRK